MINYNFCNDMEIKVNLSTETIEVLKNFSTINPSLLVKPGSILKTIHSKKTILALAKVKETFPSEFAISDLTKFITVLSAYDNPVLTFEEKHVVISDKVSSTRILHSGIATVTHPPAKDITLPSVDATFTVSNVALTKVLRLTSSLGLPNIVLVGRDGKSFLSGTNVLEDVSDGTDYEVGVSDNDYKAVFDIENMKLLPRDYSVQVTGGMAYFKSTTDDVEYWVACSTPKK